MKYHLQWLVQAVLPPARTSANDRKFNPAFFARLADGDGLALIKRRRALHWVHVAPALDR
jgi:hypothetical protein